MAAKSSGKTNKRVYDRSRRKEFRHHFVFESYGVKIRITSNEAEAIEEVRQSVTLTFSSSFREIEGAKGDHDFLLVRNPSGQDSLYKNGEKLLSRVERRCFIEVMDSRLRLTVAEFAKERVFIHAGVVAWKSRAILIPASTFNGKTALTAALVKRGALYYSDEYAVLDSDGLVHPFAKPLSIRGVINDFKQLDRPVEALGGKAGTNAIPVGLVLITTYKPGAKWKPKTLSRAKGIVELIKNAVPIRSNPEFSLAVFNQVAKSAVFVKSPRGDVNDSVDAILSLFEDLLGTTERITTRD